MLSTIDSLLALYTKLKGGKCLIYIGREGESKGRRADLKKGYREFGVGGTRFAPCA